MRRIETIRLPVGQTPMGTLTMATHAPRRAVRGVVLRERDYRELLRRARRAAATTTAERGTAEGSNNAG